MGWLTGPSTFVGPEGESKPRGYGCYLSVWRKQPDGRWRVFIDVGADAPEPVTFARGFTRTAVRDPYRGKDSKEIASKLLLDADRALNAGIASAGAAKAYAGAVTPSSRLHRNGVVPRIGPDAIGAWLGSNASGMTAETGSGESSNAGDFGYTYGTYSLQTAKPEIGPYVRIWSRDAAGRWWLMADVAHPTR